uniref:Uncharacterized protein n=1 Tax=Ditylenchus dipsaci TaxID=166011 RepID=A0A915CRD6_9BILA
MLNNPTLFSCLPPFMIISVKGESKEVVLTTIDVFPAVGVTPKILCKNALLFYETNERYYKPVSSLRNKTFRPDQFEMRLFDKLSVTPSAPTDYPITLRKKELDEVLADEMNLENLSLETKRKIGPHSGNVYRALPERLEREAIEKEKRERDPKKLKNKNYPISFTSEYLKGGIEQMLIDSATKWHVHLIEYADDYAVFRIPVCLPGTEVLEEHLDWERDNPEVKLTSPAFRVEEVDQSDHPSDTHRLVKVFCTNNYIDRIHSCLMWMAYNKHMAEDIIIPQKKRLGPIFFPPDRPKVDESIELLEMEKKFVQYTADILQRRLDLDLQVKKWNELMEQRKKQDS